VPFKRSHFRLGLRTDTGELSSFQQAFRSRSSILNFTAALSRVAIEGTRRPDYRL
jgi:hypothetical protein